MLPSSLAPVVSFLVFSLASGLAQWFIASLHIAPHDTSGMVALIFRVAMVPAVDIASLLFLAVMSFKSLKKFVADQRIRAQAVRDINEAELRNRTRPDRLPLRRQTEERQDFEDERATQSGLVRVRPDERTKHDCRCTTSRLTYTNHCDA